MLLLYFSYAKAFSMLSSLFQAFRIVYLHQFLNSIQQKYFNSKFLCDKKCCRKVILIVFIHMLMGSLFYIICSILYIHVYYASVYSIYYILYNVCYIYSVY